MTISEKEYNERLDNYLRERGPNPGTTFFGAWGWYAAKKNEFDEIMKEDGITVKN
jgi:hypothetical protein